MPETITIKRGDPFAFAFSRLNSEAGVQPLTGATVISQVRTADFVDDLVVSVTDEANGEGEVSRDGAGTALWPVGILSWDIRVVGGADPGATETAQIVVLEDVSRV